MTTEKSTTPTVPAVGAMPRTRSDIEATDVIDKGLGQLNAMLLMTCGGGYEAFHGLNEAAQDDYLWACHDKLLEVRAAWESLQAPSPGRDFRAAGKLLQAIEADTAQAQPLLEEALASDGPAVIPGLAHWIAAALEGAVINAGKLHTEAGGAK